MGPVPNSEHSHVNPLLIQLVERLRLLPEVQAVQSEREPSGMQVGDGWLASPV